MQTHQATEIHMWNGDGNLGSGYDCTVWRTANGRVYYRLHHVASGRTERATAVAKSAFGGDDGSAEYLRHICRFVGGRGW